MSFLHNSESGASINFRPLTVDMTLVDNKLGEWVAGLGPCEHAAEIAVNEIAERYRLYFDDSDMLNVQPLNMADASDVMKWKQAAVAKVLCICIEQFAAHFLCAPDSSKRDESIEKIESLRLFSAKLLGYDPTASFW